MILIHAGFNFIWFPGEILGQLILRLNNNIIEWEHFNSYRSIFFHGKQYFMNRLLETTWHSAGVAHYD